MRMQSEFESVHPGTLFRFTPDEGDPVFRKMGPRTIQRDDGPIHGPIEIFDAAKTTVYPIKRRSNGYANG
jgi:hypothetical protein